MIIIWYDEDMRDVLVGLSIRRSGFYLLVGVLLDQLADGLVAVVLQGRVVSQHLVGDVLGDLLVHACF